MIFPKYPAKFELWDGLLLPYPTFVLLALDVSHCYQIFCSNFTVIHLSVSWFLLSEDLPVAPLLPVPAAFLSFSLFSYLPLLVASALSAISGSVIESLYFLGSPRTVLSMFTYILASFSHD